jgi:uncharacterized protein (DUF302 family)
MRSEKSFGAVHVEYVSDRSVDDVAAALEAVTGSVENGGYQCDILPARDVADFEQRTKPFESVTGFMRFLTLDHGHYLALYGRPRKVRQYLVGNPVIAATMVRHDAQAALDVPVRILIFEGEDGRTRLCYDLPSSLMSHIGNADLDAAARKLDAKLADLAAELTGQ